MRRPHRVLAFVLQLLLVHLAIVTRPMTCAAEPATAGAATHTAHDAHRAVASHDHASSKAPSHERHGAGHCETSCLPSTCPTAQMADVARRADAMLDTRGEIARAPRALAVTRVVRGPEPPPPRA